MNKDKTLLDFVKEAKSQIKEVEISDVIHLLDEGYQILDVREPAEYISGTIDGALNIPVVYWKLFLTKCTLVAAKN